MSRIKKKVELRIVEPEKLEFVLGDRTFPIIPFSEREDGYDEQTEFLLTAAPLLSKLIEVSVAATTEGADAIEALNALDFTTVIRDFSNTIPQLVQFVCKGSDPNITVKEVKKLAKSLVNKNQLKAILFQIKADNLLQEILDLRQEFSELGNSFKP